MKHANFNPDAQLLFAAEPTGARFGRPEAQATKGARESAGPTKAVPRLEIAIRFCTNWHTALVVHIPDGSRRTHAHGHLAKQSPNRVWQQDAGGRTTLGRSMEGSPKNVELTFDYGHASCMGSDGAQ